MEPPQPEDDAQPPEPEPPEDLSEASYTVERAPTLAHLLATKVERHIARRHSRDSLALLLEKTMRARLNGERDEVATLILEMPLDLQDNRILAAARYGWEAAVKEAVSVTRRRAAKMLRDRVQGDDD